MLLQPQIAFVKVVRLYIALCNMYAERKGPRLDLSYECTLSLGIAGLLAATTEGKPKQPGGPIWSLTILLLPRTRSST
jgi:hypothetical protein